jgi:hypothetical protein
MKVTDPELIAAMEASKFPQQLVAPDGRVLGRYVPAIPNMTFPELDVTDDELQRILNDPTGWVSAEEVKQHLITLNGSL